MCSDGPQDGLCTAGFPFRSQVMGRASAAMAQSQALCRLVSETPCQRWRPCTPGIRLQMRRFSLGPGSILKSWEIWKSSPSTAPPNPRPGSRAVRSLRKQALWGSLLREANWAQRNCTWVTALPASVP